MVESPWEDNLLERKVESDLKDLLKTLVAFANSVRPGHTAVILIGERNDGSVQGVTNPDNIQKKVREDCEKIYPPVAFRSTVYRNENLTCVRIEIEYDGDTPHFGGPAWVRRGSETLLASEEVFQLLIDTRSGLVRELTKWLDRLVSVKGETQYLDRGTRSTPWPGKDVKEMKLIFVNAFWITLRDISTDIRRSLPISKIRLNFDDEKGRLAIETLY